MQRPTPESSRTAPRAVRAFAAAGALLATALLSGCGLVAGFVPPVGVGDPLGVDGKQVQATVQEGPIQSAIVTHIDETASFDVADLDQRTYGFSLKSFSVDAGLEPTVTLTGTVDAVASDFPESFTVTRARIEASLEDDVNGSVAFERTVDLGLTFERADTCEPGSCDYSYAGDLDLADALDLELTDRAKLRTLLAILVKGEVETPNRGSFRVAVEFDSDPSLAGYTATFTLTSEGSEIKLGG